MPEPDPVEGSVLLTGATGFIGRRILKSLLDSGWSVRALVRASSSRAEGLDPRVQIIEGGLDDPAALGRGLAGTVAVINCAGSVRGNSQQDFETANVAGVRSLCEAIDRLTAQPALLHLSSLAASEPQLSFYAASKREGERVVESYDALNWCVIRPPAVYGPGDVEMKPTLAWVRRGLVPVPGGNRAQRLSLLHVDDLVAAVQAWLGNPDAFSHRCFAIDDGHPDGYDWKKIASAVARRKPVFLNLPEGLLMAMAAVNERLARLTGRAVMLSRGKVRELTHPRWVADNTGFRAVSGWTPHISLAEGAKGLFES